MAKLKAMLKHIIIRPHADGDCGMCGAASGHFPSCPFYNR